MAIVTQTDRPKSVRNRYVIKVFGGVFVLSRCFLDLSVGEGAFAIGLSQIFSFFTYKNCLTPRQHTCKVQNIADNNLNKTISELDLSIFVTQAYSEFLLQISMNDRHNMWQSEII